MPKFATDIDMQYRVRSYKHVPGSPYVLSPRYKERILPLVNPGHPALAKSAVDAAEKLRGVSFVSFIRPETMPKLGSMISEIASVLPPNTFVVSNGRLMHFTLHSYGDLSGWPLANLPREISDALAGLHRFNIQIKGTWLPDFLRGRAFLRVYPQIGAVPGMNMVSDVIGRIKGADEKAYPIGFLQFKRDLDAGEFEGLSGVLNKYDEFVFTEEAQVERLSLVRHSDDLLMRYDVLKEISLG